MSFSFDLTPGVREAKTKTAMENPLDPADVTPAFFDRFADATGLGVMRGGARVGTAVAVAGAVAPIATDRYLSSFMTDDVADFLETQGVANPKRGTTTTGQDAYFKNVVEDTGQTAVSYWTPDAAEVGTAGRVIGGLAEIVLPLAAGGGNPALLAATEGLERPASLVKEGVSPGAAIAVGTVGSAVTLAGFKIPAAFGSTLAQRVATGAGANLALGTIGSGAQYATLKAAGNDKQAAAFNPADAEARTVDLFAGAVFGGLAHVSAPKAPLAQRDAVLTARNADSFQRNSIPGEPLHDGADLRGQRAMESALEQLSRGDVVNVSDKVGPSDFQLPVEPPVSSYTAYRHALESGGRADATNPNSSAFGADQFIASTWRRIVAAENPTWAQGMSDSELLAARGDPAKSAEMVAALDKQNTVMLRDADLPVTHHTLYAAHHFGPASARRFARAADDMPMEQIITAGQLAANPYLNGKTKGEAIANWDERAFAAGVEGPTMTARLDASNFGQAEWPRSIADADPFWDSVPGRETINIDTPERQVMRDGLVDEHFAGVEPPLLTAGERPIAYVMGGGGGSGKGYILKQLQRDGAIPRDGVVHIDPDAIKAGERGISGIPEYHQMRQLRDSRAAAVVHEESSQIAQRVRERAVTGKYDLVLDRTLGDPAKGRAELQALRDAGYEIRLFGVTADPRVALDRAGRRAAGSGRYVPTASLLKAHKGFAEGFEDYARLSDAAVLYDNTGQANILARGRAGEFAPVDKPAYDQFRARRSTNEQATTYRELLTPATADGLRGHRRGTPESGNAPDGPSGAGDRGAGAGGESQLGMAYRRSAAADGRETGQTEGRSGGSEVTSPEAPTAALARVAAENPDAVVNVGDGDTPTFRNLADALDDIEGERSRAESDSRAYQAAINCFLRRG